MFFFPLDNSTQVASGELENRHLQEDHDRLMERHSALLQVGRGGTLHGLNTGCFSPGFFFLFQNPGNGL